MAAPPAGGSPVSPPPAAEAAAAAPPRRWRLRDAAGSLGSLISQYGAEGVGLLVPTLGGAVDIVVVRQPDGSLKSSPFYVRFGKYQGVLRSRYKRVEVWVNGEKTPLFMHLGRTGEAFFGDEALLRDGDAAAGAAAGDAAGGAAPEAAQDASTADVLALVEAEEPEPLIFAQELDASEPVSAAQQSLVSRLDVLTGGEGAARAGSDAESEDAEAEGEGASSASSSLNAGGGGGGGGRWAFWRGSGGSTAPAAAPIAAAEDAAAAGRPRPAAARPLALPRIDSALSDVYATPRGVAGDDAAAAGGAAFGADWGDDDDVADEADGEDAAEAALAAARAQLAPGCAELSLCGDDVAPGAFEAAAVSRAAFAAGAEALLADPRLRLRVAGGAPATLQQALPSLLSLLAFGTPMPARSAAAAAPAAAARAPAEPAAKAAARPSRRARRLRPTAEEIAALGLADGRNIVTFVVNSSVWGRQEVCAQVFLWEHSAKVVISDIDGTITKSDLMGHVMPILGRDWAHDGVAALYNAIAANGYQLAFLSARSVGQADTTRSYLRGLQARPGGQGSVDGDGVPLAPGPVILAPDGITTALVRELIRRAPAEFKIACLTDIRGLFPPDWNPFYAGFGNRGSDVISYAAVGVPRGRTFTINPRGELACEALHHTRRFTLPTLATMLDEFFPPVVAKGSSAKGAQGGARDEFGDVAFWRPPPRPMADDDPELAALAAQAAPAPGRSAFK